MITFQFLAHMALLRQKAQTKTQKAQAYGVVLSLLYYHQEQAQKL